MDTKEFQQQIAKTLARIDPRIPVGLSDPAWELPYRRLEAYAAEHQLRNMALALPLVQEMAIRSGGMNNSPFGDTASKMIHCLSMSMILIDLRIPLTKEEEDHLISAALCHILPPECPLFQLHGVLDEEVFRIIATVRLGKSIRDDDLTAYIHRVREDRLALLLRLADRGNLVEKLHAFSGWSTRRYIYETRNFYLPMCVYAKERYPELIVPVTILMEKMRSLIAVAEILLSRYETQETELMEEILALQEENSMLRDILQKLRREHGL